jgi:DNA-binding transcriptional LysR family regulator
MDIEIAGTFVEVVSTGSFIKPAERLHAAQTILSARMRLLEQQLRSLCGEVLVPR